MSNEHDLFGLSDVESSNIYTSKVNIPQYLPSGVMPHIDALYNDKKYTELMRNIHTSSLGDEEKDFLRMAATRHIVFEYGKIADYYAQASPEMQRLMEQSALVIIDFEDAIANGYVKLSKNIKELMERTGRPTEVVAKDQ